MEWHEDLQNLAQQQGLKGKKLNKARNYRIHLVSSWPRSMIKLRFTIISKSSQFPELEHELAQIIMKIRTWALICLFITYFVLMHFQFNLKSVYNA